MDSHRLSDDVYAAIRGEDLLLLSLASDQYFCVPAAGAGLRLIAGSSAVEIGDHDLADVLVGCGFVATSGPPEPRAVMPGPVRQEAGRGPRPMGPLVTVQLAAAAALVAAKGFHGQSFAQLVSAANARSGQGRTDLVRAADLGCRFATALPWVPSQGDCLYRSYVLQALLAREGLAATWVFGVQTWPFEAHCWVQIEDMVLDDTCDHVSAFTPILAL
ncbi:lasso peptide biosynthesis B2 protein [Phenylobacterium sp.]|uniref:lasso peptide biosynthesis B2 protein n=1 Tax=Phenylobacterium sp. TaxID=1871053 RepID=UPI002730D3E6|nr:lasso peptide biosynthesis B2 protein [Phenylobacterium sp.]MDP1875193.1 lasso peptide biosynthesis B2 protein [Phenylobacterium sp.]